MTTRSLLFLFLGVLCAGADCVPGIAIAEAAECCTCVARTNVDGARVSGVSQNCLPDDRFSTGGVTSAEEDACSAGAGEALTGNGAIFVAAGCLDEPHPCASICAAANADRDVFVTATP